VVTQSGANGRSVVEGVAMGASFHRWITAGNEVDLEVADYIHHFVHAPEVGVIALYVEGFKSPAKLRVALEDALLSNKPVVAIKMGSTERALSPPPRTRAYLAGSDAVVKGLFRQYGVTRVDDLTSCWRPPTAFQSFRPAAAIAAPCTPFRRHLGIDGGGRGDLWSAGPGTTDGVAG